MENVKYKRVLLKLSGESLMGEDAFGINRKTIMKIVAQVKEIADMGVQVGIVVGGGNIFRVCLHKLAAWTEQRRITWA